MPREDWEQKFKDDHGYDFAGAKPILELAFPDTFAKQVATVDALYLHGGDDHLIQYWLRKFDIPKIWDGKVVATNSASSNALSTQFWTCDWRLPMDGLGVLPVKFLPHYQSEYGKDDPRGAVDWEAGLRALEAYGDTSLPIHALKEGEFVVIER